MLATDISVPCFRLTLLNVAYGLIGRYVDVLATDMSVPDSKFYRRLVRVLNIHYRISLTDIRTYKQLIGRYVNMLATDMSVSWFRLIRSYYVPRNVAYDFIDRYPDESATDKSVPWFRLIRNYTIILKCSM